MAYVKLLAVIMTALLFLGLGIGSSTAIPDHAKVYANDAQKTYIGMSSTIQAKEKMRLTTMKDVRSLKYLPDAYSRDNGDFVQEGRSLTGILFEKIGILSPLKSRWNKDGSWNW